MPVEMVAHSYMAKIESTRLNEATTLEALLRIIEAASLVELERHLDQYISAQIMPAWWSVVCTMEGVKVPVVQMGRGTREHGQSGALLSFPLTCGTSLRGVFELERPVTAGTTSFDGADTERALEQLVRILNSTVSRLCYELQSVAQSAELSFIRSIVAGEASKQAGPDLDAIATTLLGQVNVSSLQVIVFGPGPAGLAWGISSRRLNLLLSVEERRRLLELLETSSKTRDGAPRAYALKRDDEVQALAGDYELGYLRQVKSLLIVPIRTDGMLLGAVIAGEEREWARQPISRQAISVCIMLAGLIAGSVVQSRLLSEVIARGQFMQALIDSLDDGVLTAKDGDILSWNAAARHLFGYSWQEVLGKRLVDVLPGAPREAIELSMDGEWPRDDKRSFEWKMRTTGGRELLLACTVTRLREFSADAPTVMYVFREVGQERELEYLKDELLSSVSHELRTPLNGIYGFSRLLLERPHMPEDMRREALQSLQDSTARLTRMADDFIDVARARRHRLPLQLEDIEIADVLRSGIGELKRRHPTHRISLRLARDLGRVRADSLRVRQILDNLVSNAAKYSPEGTRITISARRHDDGVEVSVSDHGCGIPKAVQDRVFEPFYRADNSRSRRASGVGLGLSIVKSLVEAHEGQVKVRSVLERGSTFSFTLPACDAIGV